MELELVARREALLRRGAAPVDEHAAEIDRRAPLGFGGMTEPRDVKRKHALARVPRRSSRAIDETSILVGHGSTTSGRSAADHRSSFCSKVRLAYAGLVDGNTCVASAAQAGSSRGSTLRRYRPAAVLPLKQMARIRRWRAKNSLKSLTTIVAGTIAESRLPSRSPAASTSHTAIPCARSLASRSV